MSYLFEFTSITVSLFTALILTPILIRISHTYRILDYPGEHKRHKRPVPLLGGVVLFVSVWMSVFISRLLFADMFSGLSVIILYIFFGSLIIFLVGLSDDLKPLPAWIKLIAQIASALLLYLGGVDVEFLTTPFGSIELGHYSIIITILWVVMLTNAINLIDGLDGLATGVSLIGAITMLVIGIMYQIGGILVFILALIGFFLIFLYYNRYPAKIFLGDSGSMQIGFYFAVFSLLFPLKSYTFSALYLPLLALGVPLLEVISSFTRRLMSGKNIMKADRRHLFHYLALFGLSPSRVVLVFYLLAIVYGACAIAMFYWDRVIVFAILLFFMVVIFSIFYIFISKLASRKNSYGKKEI